jgi:hypothetical protein
MDPRGGCGRYPGAQNSCMRLQNFAGLECSLFPMDSVKLSFVAITDFLE